MRGATLSKNPAMRERLKIKGRVYCDFNVKLNDRDFREVFRFPMNTELVAILITNGSGGQVFYFSREEWARLEKDFSNYKQYDHPTVGSYTHCLPEAKSQSKSPRRLWRRLAGKASQQVKLELEFPGLSIISNQ